MAAEVVDALEAVEVDDEKAELLAVPLAAGDGRVELLLEEAAVVEPGELVARGELLHLLVEHRVLHRGRNDVAKRLAEVHVGRVELAVDLVDDLHHPDRLATADEREHEQGVAVARLEK